MSTQLFPRPVGDIGLGAFSAEGPVISLQDLAQLEVRVTWDEAVAIVEELCVAAQGSIMRPIPQAGDIILNANGTVALRHSAAGVPDPVEAARRLHELLGGSVAPAPLRLFVSQAVSSGHYNSLSEFDDALAYFAKPGRQDRVKAVYQRASEQLMVQPQSTLEQARAKPRSTPPPKAESAFAQFAPLASLAQHRSWQRHALLGVAAAATASAVVTMAYLSWPKRPAPAPPAVVATTVPDAVTVAVDSGATAVVTVASAVVPTTPAAGTRRTPLVSETPVVGGWPVLAAASMPLTGSAAAINYRGPRVTRPGFRGQVQPAAAVPAAAFSLPAPAPATAEPARPAVVSPATAVRLQAPVQRAAVPAPATSVPSSEGQPVYTAGDAAVQPAVLSKPQILPPPFVSQTGRPVRMEVIVGSDGSVERARFLEVPQRMADMMLLSSAKTWVFTPAMRDGQPVRYRTVLTWAAAP